MLLEKRQGGDVVKNNTPDADASVDQYSIAIVMIQVMLGRAHLLYKHAVTQKKVWMIALWA